MYTCQHRKWLPKDHKFCRDLVAFDGVREMGLPPPKAIVVDIFKEVELRA